MRGQFNALDPQSVSIIQQKQSVLLPTETFQLVPSPQLSLAIDFQSLPLDIWKASATVRTFQGLRLIFKNNLSNFSVC